MWYVYFNHRLVGQVSDERLIEDLIWQNDDMIQVLEIDQMLGEEQWYLVTQDGSLGHVGPSETWDGGSLRAGDPEPLFPAGDIGLLMRLFFGPLSNERSQQHVEITRGKCDHGDCKKGAIEWWITRRPSDPSEVVATLAMCKMHRSTSGEHMTTTKEQLIKDLTPTRGGSCCSAEMVNWLYTDEAIEALGKIGILFVSV